MVIMCLVMVLSGVLLYEVYVNWQAGRLFYRSLKSMKQGELFFSSKSRDLGIQINRALISQIAVNPYFELDLYSIMAYEALKQGEKNRQPQWLELARKLYEELLYRLPTSSYCAYLAEALFHLGREAEGLKYIKQGLKYTPSNVKLLRAIVYYYQKKQNHKLAQYWQAERDKYAP